MKPGSPDYEKGSFLKTEDFSIQPVRKSGIVVPVYDSVDKNKILGKYKTF
jgi:hypothetical protein